MKPSKIMKTKKEIIEETRKYYEGHPERRAVERGLCCYWTEDGKRCAVGRCMMPQYAEKYADDGGVKNLQQESGKELDQLLKKEYRGHETRFWKDLQMFHDHGTYWNHSGEITEDGKRSYNTIFKKWT